MYVVRFTNVKFGNRFCYAWEALSYPREELAGGAVTCGETKGTGREGPREPAANSRILTPWNCIFHSFILQMKEQWPREDEKQD